MKLFRFGATGQERPGVLDRQGNRRDLSGHINDISGEVLHPDQLANLQRLELSALPLVAIDERFGPCVASVGKFICIGLNYSDHAAESGVAVPTEPVVFMKATSAIMGPNDHVVIPRNSRKTERASRYP